MSEKTDLSGCWAIAGTLTILVLVAALYVIKSAHEAKTFNRLTGSNVTTWDALWVELRVQEGIKE